jgi:hypothetical protein
MREALWVELEVLTPTHIGGGTDINPTEYWIDEGLARVQMNSLFADHSFTPYLEAFIANAASERYIGQHLPSDLICRHIRYQVPMAPDARQYIVQHQVVIKEYIKSAGRPFIPGSSIKGSILSALMYCVLGEECRSLGSRESIEQCISNEKGFVRLLDMTIGGLKNQGSAKRDRFSRWIDVSDSNLSQPEKSLNVYYSELVGTRKGSLPILFEGLVPGTKWMFSLATGPEFRFRLDEVLEITNAFYRAVWKKSGIRENPPENGFLLRLGQGSSAWATSLLLFAEAVGLKYTMKSPKTRKLIDAHTPMGWVLLAARTSEGPEGWKMPEPSDTRFGVGSYSAMIGEEPSIVQTSRKNIAQASTLIPKPAQKRPALLDTRANLSAKVLLGLITKLSPSDRIGLERILDGLEGLDQKQATGLAIALRERLRSLGHWEKHPKRFDIECLIQGGDEEDH